MEQIQYCRTLPVFDEVDILVVGAGPAGIGAAISAARSGAKTMLFDQNGYVGGQATAGRVGPFMTCYDAKNENMIIRGIFKEIVERMKVLGGAIDPKEIQAEEPYSGFYKIGHAHVGPFEHECFKQVSTDMLLEAGVTLLLHTFFVDVVMEEKRISGVVVANKSGMSVIRAKIVIDCSGDADVAAKAGVPFELGNTRDGNIQPATLFFRVGNVNTEELKAHIRAHADEIRPFYGPFSWLIREKKEEWKIPRGEIGLFEGPEAGIYRINTTRILNTNGTDVKSLTSAELEGLRQAHEVFDFLKKYAAGFEHVVFLDTADMVGIRESRHIKGKYWMTGEDVLACRVPEDTIAVMATNMDTHNKDNPGGSFITIQNGSYFGVPYRCLLPQGVENLLVAGRCISADALAGSAIRMIPCCLAFGQAAGTAATLSLKKHIDPVDVCVGELRACLEKQDVYLGGE